MTPVMRVVVSVPLLLLVACQDRGSTLLAPDFAKSGGGKSENIPLVAVYRDAPGDGVTSDSRLGQADPSYIDGVDGLESVILPIGNFRVSAKSPSPRKLCIDFGALQPPPELGQPWCDNGYQASADAELAGGLPAMAVNQTMTSRSQVIWVTAGFNWFLRFGTDCAGSVGNVVPENRVLVTRLDASTWRVESPTGNAMLCKMPVSGRPATTFVGTYTMPFQLILRLKG